MTIEEMHIEVRQGLDKIDSLQYADIAPEQIDLRINRSQDILVEKLYKNKLYNDIAELDINEDVALTKFNTTEIYGNNAYYTLVSNLSFPPLFIFPNTRVLHSRVSYPIIAANSYVSTIPIDKTEIWKFVVDDFNKPIFKSPRIFVAETIQIIVVLADGYSTLKTGASPDGLYISYCKTPQRVVHSTNTNCELNNRLHRKIVDLAINLLKGDIESPGLEFDTQQLQVKM